MKKLFLRAEFGPLWEPWEEDEIGRKEFPLPNHCLFSEFDSWLGLVGDPRHCLIFLKAI